MAEQTVLRTVGRYEILREIGRGGMAVVYLARQTDLDRLVALKELAAFRARDETAVQRFLRESRLTGALNHPNVVTVHEYFEHDGTPYIAMEYFERGSLRPLVETLTLPQVGGALEGILAGLAHAEERGIVHRDLKPENVMVTASGGVKIADFGIAKALQDQALPALTTTDSTVGTPAYMAPEQALGGEIGPWTDLYATGVVAYELLARRLPFDQAEMPMAVLLRQVNEPFPRLDVADPRIDPALAGWVASLLAKAPSERPGRAGDAWEELEEILLAQLGPRWRRDARLPQQEATVEPRAAITPTAPMARPARSQTASQRARRLLPLAAVPLLLAAGVAVAFALGGGGGGGGARRATGQSQTASTATVVTARPTVLRTVHATTNQNQVLLTMPLAGAALRPGSLIVRDGSIADGRLSFDLRAAAIRSRLHRWTRGRLSLRVRTLRDRLRFDLAAPAGAFERASVSRRGGTLMLALRKAQAQQPLTTTSVVQPPPSPPAPPPPASPPPPPPPPPAPPPPPPPTSSTTVTETVGGG